MKKPYNHIIKKKKPAYAMGGDLYKTNKPAFVDSTLQANKNKDFVKRLYEPNTADIQVEGQKGRSTHLMTHDPESMRVYPSIVRENGVLRHLKSGDEAFDYADKTGEFIQFKTPEQAAWFAENGYKEGNGVLKDKLPKMKDGGTVQPYQSKDETDYNKRLKQYNDSNEVYLKYKNKTQPSDYEMLPPDEFKQQHADLSKKIIDIWHKQRTDDTKTIEDAYIKYGIHRVKGKTWDEWDPASQENYTKYKDIAFQEAMAITQPRNKILDKTMDPMRARIAYLENVVGHPSVKLNDYYFNSKDPNFREKGMKPNSWDKSTHEAQGEPTATSKGAYGQAIDWTNKPKDGKAGAITKYTQYSPLFKAPVQKILPPIKQEVVQTIPQEQPVQPQTTQPPPISTGEYTSPHPSYPNVDIIYNKNNYDMFIQNKAGERLPYGTDFNKEWQYKKSEQTDKLVSKYAKGGKLPKYAYGDYLKEKNKSFNDATGNNFALKGDDPSNLGIGLGMGLVGSMLPIDQQDAALKAKTSSAQTQNKVDATLAIGTQFTPTGGLITKGGAQLGDSLSSSIGGKAGAVTGDAVKYGAAGAEIGNAFVPGLGTAVGAGVGLVAGAIAGATEGDQAAQIQREEAIQRQKDFEQGLKNNYQSAINQGFKTKGNANVTYAKGGLTPSKAKEILKDGTIAGKAITDKQKAYFGLIASGKKPYKMADGGDLYEAEKGEMIEGSDTQVEDGKKIASDMTLVGGDKHEDGGTLGAGGDRVFSDRIKISESLNDLLKDGGMGDKKNKTYANVTEYLAKEKSKYEKIMTTKNPYKANTGRLMLDRINKLVDVSFNEQEMGKRDATTNDKGYMPKDNANWDYKKAYGGKLPKYAKGVKLKKWDGVIETKPLPFGPDNYISPAGFDNGTTDFGTAGLNTFNDAVVPTAETMPTTSNTPTYNINNAITNPLVKTGYPTNTPTTPYDTYTKNQTQAQPSTSGFGKFLKDNQGNIINTASYFLNTRDINSLQTDVPYKEVPMPRYIYNDRSGLAKRDLAEQAYTLNKDISSASSQGDAATKQAIFAKTISGMNAINTNEGERSDSYKRDYSNRLDAAIGTNVSIYNDNTRRKIEAENNKKLLGTEERGKFVGQLAKEQERKDMNSYQNKQLDIEAAKSGTTGEFDRSELRRLLEAENPDKEAISKFSDAQVQDFYKYLATDKQKRALVKIHGATKFK